MKKPAISTENPQQLDNQFLHPWEDMALLDSHQRTVVQNAHGVYIEDSDGNRLLDGPAGMWCVNIGHHRQEMADAIADQVMKLTYVSPWSLTNRVASELAGKLASISPADLNHVFFTTCGSTAVDSALRFVMFRNNVLGRKDKKHVISRHNAYHGSTYLAASASAKARDKTHTDFITDTFHHISDPNPLNKPDGLNDEQYVAALAGEFADKVMEIGSDRVAAYIAEPVMASGGVILAPPGYHAAMQAVCREHDVVYISDEVVTAFGRLGYFFASEALFGITPDIITCAKGITSGYIPLGAFLVSDRLLADLSRAESSAVFSNGFTYSGHPVACAAALKNIEIMEREDILQHVREISPYFQKQLRTLNNIDIVRDVRGIGLMACVECNISKTAGASLEQDYAAGERIDRHCQALGLLVRPLINMCIMSPPLIISRNQIDALVDKLRQGIELARHDVIREGLWQPAA